MVTSVWLLLMMMMRVASSYTLVSARSLSRWPWWAPSSRASWWFSCWSCWSVCFYTWWRWRVVTVGRPGAVCTVGATDNLLCCELFTPVYPYNHRQHHHNDNQYHQCHYHCYHRSHPIILSTSSLANNSLHCESFIAKRLGLSDSPILFSLERQDQSKK